MDIQGSNNSSRVRWQPTAGASGLSGVAGSKVGSADAGEKVGFHGVPTGETKQVGGLTATNHSMVEGLPTLELPSRESVAADTQKVGDELRMALAMAGIKSDPPLAFRVDTSGTVKVDGDDPRAAEVNNVLSREPELQNRLRKLVSDAQMMEHADAVDGYYSQVNAGADAEAASKRLVAAGQKISGATGFTLDAGGKLSLECAGMGKDLMPPEPTQVSDEEKMWREMMRLTDRTRRTGVVAAAEDAQAAEKQDRDRREDTGDRSTGQPDLGQGGSGASGTGAAKAAA